MRSHLRWACTPLVIVTVAAGCPASDAARDPARDSTRLTTDSSIVDTARATDLPAWYNRARTVDLTGDGQPDSVRLVAVGARPDSLQVTLTFLVDGTEKHSETWGSSYELALVDSAIRGDAQRGKILRAKLDSVLESVVVESFGRQGVRVMAEDSAVLAGLDPRPTRRISFSYGFESTTRLVWDAPRARFVRLWSCC